METIRLYMFIYINVYGSIIYDCKIKYLDNIIIQYNNEQESAAGPEQSGNAAEVNDNNRFESKFIEEETKEDISVQLDLDIIILFKRFNTFTIYSHMFL